MRHNFLKLRLNTFKELYNNQFDVLHMPTASELKELK